MIDLLSLSPVALVFLCMAMVFALWQGVIYADAPASAAKSAVKTASVALLALTALAAGGPLWLVAGLALGALGDWCLSRPTERAFLAGMGAFALGHLVYVAGLIPLGSFPPPLVPALALLVLGASTEIWLAPRTGALRWPVRGYVVIILMMALAALALPARHGLLILGAMAFLTSDLLLSIEMFCLEDGALRRALKYLLWALYWGGQALILLGGLAAMGG